MDMKLHVLALSIFAALIVEETLGAVQCYNCDYTAVDGDRIDGDSYCETGEKAISKDKTKSCNKGCHKLELTIKLTPIGSGSSIDFEYVVRGCADDNEKNECEDENDISDNEIEAFEDEIEQLFSGYNATVKSADNCYCDSNLCNSAPSDKAVIHSILYAVTLLVALSVKLL